MREIIEKSDVERSEKNNSSIRKDIRYVKKNRNNSKNILNNQNDGNETSEECKPIKKKTFTQNATLDKVAQDLRRILSQLENAKGVEKSATQITLKMEDKEFFKIEDSRKKSLANSKSQHKNRRKISFTVIDKLSRNSINIPKKDEFNTRINRTNRNLEKMFSNQQTFTPKVPITKSEMDNFKHKVVQNANAVLKLPEKLKEMRKEKVAEQVKNLMNQALKDSEITHTVPVIDIGKFINRSLKMATSNDFPDLKNIAKQKTISEKDTIVIRSNKNLDDKNISKNSSREGDIVNNNRDKSYKTIEKFGRIAQIENKKLEGNELEINKTSKYNNNMKMSVAKNSCNSLSLRIAKPLMSQTSKCSTNNLSNNLTSRRKSKTNGNLIARRTASMKANSMTSNNQNVSSTIMNGSPSSYLTSSSPSGLSRNTNNFRKSPVDSEENKKLDLPTVIKLNYNDDNNNISSSMNNDTIKSKSLTALKTMNGVDGTVGGSEINKLLNKKKSTFANLGNLTKHYSSIAKSSKQQQHAVSSPPSRQNDTNELIRNRVQRRESYVGKSNSISSNSIKSSKPSSRLTSRPSHTSSLFSSSKSKMLTDRLSNFGLLSSTHSYYKDLRTRRGIRSSNVCNDPIIQLRDDVNRAIRDRKTFTINGNYFAVRRALLKRGWVEKYSQQMKEKLELEVSSLKNRSVDELADMPNTSNLNELCKKLIKSKLLGNHQVDLYWTRTFDSSIDNFDKGQRKKLTLINKFKRDVFSYTSKKGLSEAIKSAHWYNFPGLAQINHPRTYVLSMKGEQKEFVKDFRRTAAMSLLKWVIRNSETKESKILSNCGKIPLETFHFAVNECFKMLIEANNLDIDHPLKEARDHEWKQFLEYYYKILHIGYHFKTSGLENEQSIVEKSKMLMEKLKMHFPHIQMDGTMNIWILKPACGSQGKGIHICRTLQYIMETVKHNFSTSYIVQKYIERPLLIFNTKFDIRQWFLISSTVPLTIWMYRECYLRFSSQTYNLRKLHESIHLTNNSVQQKYQNLSHDITLPKYNMWDSIQFKNYLSNTGYPDIYNKVIYKGMKECILGAVLIHQDKISKRRNSFELYGADFMLTEDYQPWLIEINSSPALQATTPITAKMCPQVLEDVIKVVVDRANDSKAKTGLFEMIYKQPNIVCNNSQKMCDVKVCGKPLPRDYFCLDDADDQKCVDIKTFTLIENLSEQKSQPKLCKSCSEMNTILMKNTLQKLLDFIQNEKKKKKRQKKPVAIGTDPISVMGKIECKKSSSTCTSLNLSLTSLKSQLDTIEDYENVNINEEDENMIDEALKMLKDKRNNQVLKCLFSIIARIVNKTPEFIQA